MSVESLQPWLEKAAEAARHNEPAEAVRYYGELLAQSTADAAEPAVKKLRLRALAERGQLLGELGDQKGAMASFNQCYLEAGTSQQAVDALALLGDQHSQMGHHTQALEANQEALQLAQALNYTAGRAQAMMRTGWTLLSLGRTEEALANLNTAYSLFTQLNDPMGQLRSVDRIGIVRVRQGEVDKAIIAFKESLKLARRIGDRETAIELGNLGECYQMLFDTEQALIYHQEGLAIAQRTKLQAVEVDLCRNLGVDLYYLGRVEEGIEFLRRALEISGELDRPDATSQALYSLALAEVELGEVAAAQGHAEALRLLAEETNARGYLADALHVLGLCRARAGQGSEAEQLWQQALFLAHETNRRLLLWQIHAALAEQSGNPALGGVHRRIAAEVIQQIAEPIGDADLKSKFLNAPRVRPILRAAAG